MPLLAHGTLITDRYAAALIAQGIHAVWVEDGLSDGIEPAELLPEPVRAETADRVRGALDRARAGAARGERVGA